MNKKIIKSVNKLETKLEVEEKYHFINIIMPDGNSFVCKSTYGNNWEKLCLEVDYKHHSAWLEKKEENVSKKIMKDFNNKYKGMNIDI